MKTLTVKALLAQLLLFGMVGMIWAQDSSTSQSTPANDTAGQNVPADNSAVNKRDRNAAEVTADQQKENRSDRELARQIRQALVKDKTLSTYAHNVKVVVQNGAVTLKGPVKSEEEKQAVEAKAAQVAGGADKVTDQIEVATK